MRHSRCGNTQQPEPLGRKAEGRKPLRDPESIFNRVFFRSPSQLLAAAPVEGVVRTAVHFSDTDDPADLERIERKGKRERYGGVCGGPLGKGIGMQANLENVAIVLKGPKFPGNVGSAARCAKKHGSREADRLWGTGTSTMRLSDRWPPTNPRTLWSRSAHCDTLDEALADFSWVVGTTARQGTGRGPVVSPRRMAESLVGLSRENRIALLFGPEDTGLTNDDLGFCQTIVTITNRWI